MIHFLPVGGCTEACEAVVFNVEIADHFTCGRDDFCARFLINIIAPTA